MRFAPWLVCLAVAGCKSKSEAPAAVSTAVSTPQPKTPPSDERFANRYLMIAAAKPTLEEAKAEAPADATFLESTKFSGLTPCLFVAVVAVYEKKAEALAAATKSVLPRHSGKYVPNDPERKAICDRKRQATAQAKDPRWVENGLMDLGARADEAENAPPLTADPTGAVRVGDAFDVYTANGVSVSTCKVKGFVARWSGDAMPMEAGPCGEYLALAELDCATGQEPMFALPAGAPAPAAWTETTAPAEAEQRLLKSAAVKQAKAALKEQGETPTETPTVKAWRGPGGTVSFVRWVGETGDGIPECGRGERTTVSEVVFWPDKGKPRVLHAAQEREAELEGVMDLGSDGNLELTWAEGSAHVWTEGTTMQRSHPFCGCGC